MPDKHAGSFLTRGARQLRERLSKARGASAVETQAIDAATLELQRTERQRVVDTARDGPFLDGVFSVLLFNRFRLPLDRGPYSHDLKLEEAFPSAPESDLSVARDRASRLLRAAYAAGDSHIASNFTNYAAVMTQLAADHPGFSAKTYDEAIKYGCYQAR